MVCVLCVALVELLVLDACLVMGGVERDPFCCNFDYFCFLFSIQVRVLKDSRDLYKDMFNMDLIYFYFLTIEY